MPFIDTLRRALVVTAATLAAACPRCLRPSRCRR